MATVRFLVGSTYGNAQQAAEDAAELLNELGHETTVDDSASLEQVLAANNEILVICTATIGDGDIPDNLLAFYENLYDQGPPLNGRRYGVIALGDSSYDEFAGAGHLFDRLMKSLQAQEVQPMLVVDAIETPDPEEAVANWITEFSTKI